MAYIKDWLGTASIGDVVHFKDIYKHLDMKRSNFTGDVRKHADFAHVIAELGLVEYGGNKQFTGWRIT